MHSAKTRSQQKTDHKRTKAATATAATTTQKTKVLSSMTMLRSIVTPIIPSQQRSVNSMATEATEIGTCVSFNEYAAVCPTIALKDYSTEELKATWYTDSECSTIVKQCCHQISKMDKGEVLKDKKYCARGLEAHTRMGSIVKHKNRAESINAVLREQETQFLKNDWADLDDEAIARVYHQATSSCQMWANALGFRDKRTVQEYMDDVELQVPRAIITHDLSKKKMKAPSNNLVVPPVRNIATARTA
jgi:hypothetical protein